MLHRLLQGLAARVVFAVGHHKNDLLFQPRILLQVVRRRDHGIVERRPAPRINLLQRLFQLQQIVGEILVQILFVIEVHDKHFILRIARAHQIKRRLVHFAPFLPHRPGIVDHNAHRHRNVYVVKRNDVLRFAVFKDRKGAAIQRGDDVLLVVDHGSVQHHFVNIFLKDEDSLVVEFLACVIVSWSSRSLIGGRLSGRR